MRTRKTVRRRKHAEAPDIGAIRLPCSGSKTQMANISKEQEITKLQSRFGEKNTRTNIVIPMKNAMTGFNNKLEII